MRGPRPFRIACDVMGIRDRRQPHGVRAWRYGVTSMLLLAVIGGAGERPRGDGAGAVATAAAPRPARASADYVANCQFAGLSAEPLGPDAILQTLMAAPVCAAASILPRRH